MNLAMSLIEDSRKALQDLIAPELRAINLRLTALERRFARCTWRDRGTASFDSKLQT